MIPLEQQKMVSRLVDLMVKSPQTFLYRKKNGQMRRGRGTLEYDVIRPHLGTGTRKRPETATAYWDLDRNEWRSFRNLSLDCIFEYYPVFRYCEDGFGIVNYNRAILAPITQNTTLKMIGPGFMSKYTAETAYRNIMSKVLDTCRKLRAREKITNIAVKPTMSVMTSQEILQMIQTIPR